MHVGNDPVAEMGDGIHILQAQQRPFQCCHTITGNGNYHEFQYRIFTYLIPGAAQGKQPVEHTAP